jgi:uncharacterized protein (TIGR03437 family)
VAVAPNGRIYASTVQNQFSSGPTTQWRGIVRYNQDTIPAAANAPSCIVLAAGSYQVAALSPGAFMAIYGNGMGPVQGVVLSQLTPEGLVSPLLGGVRVTVDNKPAALHYVQDKQVNFITPWGIPTDGTAVPVCVIFNGATTCVQASTTVAVPGAFPCDVGTGLSCAAHPGGSVNWPVSTTIGGREFRPAKPGESIEIYMTGFGKVGGTLVDGGVFTSGSRPLLGTLTASTEPPPTGGCGIFACEPAVAAAMTVNVEYAGAAGGAVLGVDQVNLKIPAEIPDGFHTFRLSFVPQGADPNKPIVIPVKMHVKK